MQDGCGRLDVSIDDKFVNNLYQLLLSCMAMLFNDLSHKEIE